MKTWRWRVKNQVQYSTLQVKAPAWMECDNMLVSVQTATTAHITDKEGAHIHPTLISKVDVHCMR